MSATKIKLRIDKPKDRRDSGLVLRAKSKGPHFDQLQRATAVGERAVRPSPLSRVTGVIQDGKAASSLRQD